MRRQSFFLFALCAAAVYSVGALPSDATSTDGKNYLTATDATDKKPCMNSIDGTNTSSTEYDGNHVLGCNNIIFNITTDGETAAKVAIYGSDNVVMDDVVSSLASDGEHGIVVGVTSETANGNEVIGNVADYIGLWSVQNSTAKGNVARNGGYQEQGSIQMTSDTDVKFSDNEADYMQINNAFNEVVQRNKVTSMDSSTYGYLHIDGGASDDIEDNTAVRACSFRRAVLGCLALSSTNLCFACCVLLC